MARYHPDSNMLLEYAAGTLDWAPSLIVSAHLHMCNHCRQQALHLNHIGGALIEAAPAVRPSRDTFRRLMGKIEQAQAGANGSKASPARPEQKAEATASLNEYSTFNVLLTDLPEIVRTLVLQAHPLQWKRVSSSLRKACLTTGQNHYEVALHQIARGGIVPSHNHRGLEITLVLAGSFSDDDGLYSAGDFLVREPGERHRPTATQDQECLCLSITEAPPAFTGVRGWVVNPLLSFRPG